MKYLRFTLPFTLALMIGFSLLATPAHAIWRSIAVTHSTAALMQILHWGPNVDRWNLKPVRVLNKSRKARLLAMGLVHPDGPTKAFRLSPAMRRKIVLTVGTIESKLAFGIINNRPAGGGIAYGYLQVLSRHGGLHRLIKLYSSIKGNLYGKALLSFGHSAKERVNRNRRFQNYLRIAGKDPAMRRAQTLFFSREYFQPTMSFGRSLGIKEPASYLLLFDAFIHYGNKKWLKVMISRWVMRDGEHRALLKFLRWMKANLHRAYTRSYGRGSLQVRYNAWRADFLEYIWLYQTKLKQPIAVKAPQWRKPVIIK